MKIRRTQKKTFFDSGSASDIAFLLIIYFIVIAGFNVNIGFIMNLPARDSSMIVLKDDIIRFELNENGEIIYNDDIVNFERSEKLISSALSVNPNIALLLTIDGMASWQNVVSFVELAQDLQIDSFSFSMKREHR